MKENYKPVSILPTLSKNVSKNVCLVKRLHFPITFFGINNAVFRKRYNTQYFLLVMLETLKKSLDKSKLFVALLIDLSKAFFVSNMNYLLQN